MTPSASRQRILKGEETPVFVPAQCLSAPQIAFGMRRAEKELTGKAEKLDANGSNWPLSTFEFSSYPLNRYERLGSIRSRTKALRPELIFKLGVYAACQG
jgi:hypothetical protein